MADYRVYKLDGAGKTTGPPTIVRCEDDAAALDLARPLADGHTSEIWEGARRVATIDWASPAVRPVTAAAGPQGPACEDRQ